jgi:hypothetical protein
MASNTTVRPTRTRPSTSTRPPTPPPADRTVGVFCWD